MATAYSYIRFSTPQQKLGNSLSRQLEETAKYAAQHGFDLDQSLKLTDEGKSGYHGKHLDGALGTFLNMIKAGRIAKRSRLYVEHLDRLSRQEPSLAQAQFLLVLNAGVEIFTTIDQQLYTRKSVNDNAGQLFLSLGMMLSNHAESAKKAERTRDNWKRVRGTSSGLCPSWIRKTPAGFEIDETKAAVVRRIFGDLLNMGTDRLAKALNAEGVPTFNTRKISRSMTTWEQTSIKQIVRSRRALGEQAIGKYIDGKRTETGEFVKNAYPAVVTEAEWFAANQAMDMRLRAL